MTHNDYLDFVTDMTCGDAISGTGIDLEKQAQASKIIPRTPTDTISMSDKAGIVTGII